jgi:putative membrane protein
VRLPISCLGHFVTRLPAVILFVGEQTAAFDRQRMMASLRSVANARHFFFEQEQEMQLMLVLGIVFSIGAVVFALQNDVAVTVNLIVWQFEGSLALVLLVALGVGVLIMGLLSSPAVIRGQWTTLRLRHQIVDLERELAEQVQRNNDLRAELARLTPVSEVHEAEVKPYIGLRTILAGENPESAADTPPRQV